MSTEKLLLLFNKERILSILSNPQQNPKETVLLLGMILIIILIILILIAIFAVEPAQRKKQKGRSRQRLLVGAEIAAVLVLILSVNGLLYTSQPRFCRACHQIRTEYQEWKTSTHSRVGCVACHQDPGIFGFINEKIERVDDLVSTVRDRYLTTADRTPIRANVSNDSCRRCHSVEKGSLVSYTIKVRHKEILGAGYNCTDCHNSVAHGESVTQPRQPSMDKCVQCHDNQVASAECRLCHVPDVGKKPRQVADYPKIHLEPPFNCEGCHDIQKCTECHGLEMPHPADWKQKHPREGFVNKQVCWRCHDKRFCRECHQKIPDAHPDDFPATHGKASQQPESCSCHQREEFCPICHETDR